MKRDDEIALFVVLVGGIALFAKETMGESIEWGDGWHWPVPDLVLNNPLTTAAAALDPTGHVVATQWRYPAEVSQEFKPGKHVGVDVMYQRQRGGPDSILYPVGDDAGGAKQNARWFAPQNTPILAAKAGKVWSTQKTSKGILVVIDHGKPWATMYAHLATTTLDPHWKGLRVGANVTPQTVDAGQAIGTMGHDPEDAAKLRHLHFACWYKGHGDAASKDPRRVMNSWLRSEW